jgi:hypothetical protein
VVGYRIWDAMAGQGATVAGYRAFAS